MRDKERVGVDGIGENLMRLVALMCKRSNSYLQ